MARTLRLDYPPAEEVRMGRIMVRVAVDNFAQPEHRIECDALVDTGAYCLTLPSAWKDRLGVLTVSRRIKVEMADRRVVEGEVCGPVTIRIEGFDRVVGEVLFMDMDAADGRYEPLVGYITLEQAGLAVDLVGHRLLRVPYLDLKGARRSAA
jgi:predicted aspartyl protease